jgi:aldehyde dehydrogenase (NAD+)
VRIGDPLDPGTGMGPLIHERAVQNMMRGLRAAKEQGGEVIYGGRRLSGCFVEPALVRAHAGMPILQEEIFAPILYLMEFERLEEAIAWHNAAPRGPASAIFTSNLAAAETFLGQGGSDWGIVNVNLGTSGAETGGAFGAGKDAGAGRDAWKAYMRRQTSTIKGSSELPPSKSARVRT